MDFHSSVVFWTVGVGVVILALAIADLYEMGKKAFGKHFLFYITLAAAFILFGFYYGG